jgi:hypothetical protein
LSADQPDPAGGQIEWIASRYLAAAQTLARADRPLVLAGDCLRSVIWLDAHGDFIDSRQVPGLRWDAGAGPSFSTIEDCLAEIVDVAPPAAACIACPWPSDRIAEASTRDVVSRLAAAIGAELQWTADRAAGSS